MTPRSDACTVTGHPAAPGYPGNSDPANGGLRRMSFLELAPLPTAVPCARLHATHILYEWGLRDLVGDAALVVSELVTNAMTASAELSGRPPVLLHLIATQEVLRVEVHDRSPHEPIARSVDPGAEHGRGLAIVAAFSQRHGSHRAAPGRKVVWAELALTPPSG